MEKIRTILAPVDFSEESTMAARYAAALARREKAEVTLLHVLPPLEFSFAMIDPVADLYRELQTKRMNAAREALSKIEGDFHRRDLLNGNPAEAILAVAAERHADVIVLPTHGAGAIRRLLLVGSVTSKLLAAADCAVWTGVRWPELDGQLEIANVACAVDLGPESARVLRAAQALASRFGATLTVVHAIPPLGESAEEFFDESSRQRALSVVRDRLGNLLNTIAAKARIVVEFGTPARVVAEAARGAGLVVVGRRSTQDLLGKLRAHAYEIVRHAHCPVVGV